MNLEDLEGMNLEPGQRIAIGRKLGDGGNTIESLGYFKGIDPRGGFSH